MKTWRVILIQGTRESLPYRCSCAALQCALAAPGRQTDSLLPSNEACCPLPVLPQSEGASSGPPTSWCVSGRSWLALPAAGLPTPLPATSSRNTFLVSCSAAEEIDRVIAQGLLDAQLRLAAVHVATEMATAAESEVPTWVGESSRGKWEQKVAMSRKLYEGNTVFSRTDNRITGHGDTVVGVRAGVYKQQMAELASFRKKQGMWKYDPTAKRRLLQQRTFARKFWRMSTIDECLRGACRCRFFKPDGMKFGCVYTGQQWDDENVVWIAQEFDDVDNSTYFSEDLTNEDYKEICKLTKWRAGRP